MSNFKNVLKTRLEVEKIEEVDLQKENLDEF